MKSIIVAGFAIALASLGVAAADTQDDIATCRAAIAEQAPSDLDLSTLDFERVRGSSLRRLTFEVTRSDGEKVDIVCRVRRGDVVGIDWPDA